MAPSPLSTNNAPSSSSLETHSHVNEHSSSTHPAHHHSPEDHDHDHDDAPTHPQPAMDASKLNHTPAPLPPSPEAQSPPLREATFNTTNPFAGMGMGMGDSAYLDHEIAPQHPTIAETGELEPSSPIHGPGPRAGQLKRRESEPLPQRRIIRLASFGGEGLTAKPALPCPGEEVPENAVEE